MKIPILIVISLFLGVLCMPVSVHALTASTSASPTKATANDPNSQSLSEKIDRLKTVLASKVAELKLVDKRGVIGSVQDVSNTQLTLLDRNSNIRTIDIDEITKFASGSGSSSFGISDIKKGMHISVLGLFNKESKRIQARFINTFNSPLYLSGVVSDIDKANFLLTLMQEGSVTEKVDNENLTKINSYDDSLDPTKIGFTKVTAGSRVIIVGYPDPKESNRMTASRILLFPTLPKDPKVQVTLSDTPIPPSEPTVILKRKTIVTP